MICMERWSVLCIICLLTTVARAQTFTPLAYFDDSSSVFSSLVQGRDGALYGVSNNGGESGNGSVFRIAAGGSLSTIYSFCVQARCSDGSYPVGALALGVDGNLYGTTQGGGASGYGTVFKITPVGAITTLHSFVGSDGAFPEAGLVLYEDGNFYGTTYSGGGGSLCSGGCGTLFRISSSGSLATVHSFNGIDGDFPSAPLIAGTNGGLYGTTAFGGTSTGCSGGCGTVFRITPSEIFASLHSFDFTDGEEPLAPLVQSATGALYGTTYEGGNTRTQGLGGYGTIFKVSAEGGFSTVLKFNSHNGGFLNFGLSLAADGNIYSESSMGGTTDAGQIFELVAPRAIETIYSFAAASGSGVGDTAMLQSTNGNFYATFGYSPSGIFSLGLGLEPFVAFTIPAAKRGQVAQILGQGLTGTTSVTFNGTTAANFTVVSDTFMTAVVPAGATTGPVVVTTPSGPLTSNVAFQITK